MKSGKRVIITLSSDFEKQSQGVGNMEGVIYGINPLAKVIHLMHGMDGFDVTSAARALETVSFMPVGLHVCVVDPGVGTDRKGLIVKTKRGDYLIGPDNGCLMTAPRFLGGVESITEIANSKYMINPVSTIFHGRHLFAPAAAHLSLGVKVSEFGPKVDINDCVDAPYKEATVQKDRIEATVIHVNSFGSIHLNILQSEWDKLDLALDEKITLELGKKNLRVPFVTTFADVALGHHLILKDDCGRIQVSINQGNFAKQLRIKQGQKIIVKKRD